jgi:hypothetical protein
MTIFFILLAATLAAAEASRGLSGSRAARSSVGIEAGLAAAVEASFQAAISKELNDASKERRGKRLICHNGVIGCPGGAELCERAVCNCHDGWSGESCDKVISNPAAKVAHADALTNTAADAARFAQADAVDKKLDAIAEEAAVLLVDGFFACAPGSSASKPCAHGGTLQRHNNGTKAERCSCTCTGDWSGPTCNECPAQDCAHGGVWNPSKCACDCPAPWRSIDHCASCETRGCGNGGSFNPHTCQCTCSGLWKGKDCSKCSVEEGDVETIDRLCGKKGFNVASCACNTECPNVRCLNGGILDSSSCTCMCNAGSPGQYYSANIAHPHDAGSEAGEDVVVVAAGSNKKLGGSHAGAKKNKKTASGNPADAFRFARSRRRRQLQSRHHARGSGGSAGGLAHQQQLLEVSVMSEVEDPLQEATTAVDESSIEEDAASQVMLLETDRASTSTSSFASVIVEEKGAAASTGSSTATAAVDVDADASLSLALPSTEQPVDAEGVHSFEAMTTATTTTSADEEAALGTASRFSTEEQEAEELSEGSAGEEEGRPRRKRRSSHLHHGRSYWAGERCQVCLPPPANPCKAGFVFSLGTCKCEPICDLSLCHNGGSVVLLRPSKSAKEALGKESAPILMEVESEVESEAEDGGSGEHITPPGSTPVTAGTASTTTDKLIATIVDNGKNKAVAAAHAAAAASAVKKGAAKAKGHRGHHQHQDGPAASPPSTSSSTSSSYVVSKEEYDRLRNGLRCGCRCKNGWGGNHCDTRASGATAASAARSCLSILAVRPKAGSGRYWINPSGVAPLVNSFQVHCDMTSSTSSTANGGWITLAKIGSKLSTSFLDKATYTNGVSASNGKEYVLPCGRFNGVDGHYSPPLKKLSLGDIRVRVEEAQSLVPAGSSAAGAENVTVASPASSSTSSSPSASSALRLFVLRLQMGEVVDYFTTAATQKWSLCDVLGSSQRHLWAPGFSERMLDGSAKVVEGGLKRVLEGPPPPPPVKPKKKVPAKTATKRNQQQQAPSSSNAAGEVPLAPPPGVYVTADTSSSSPSSAMQPQQQQQQGAPTVTTTAGASEDGVTSNEQLLAASNLRFAGEQQQQQQQQGGLQTSGDGSPDGFYGSLPNPTQPSLFTPPNGGGAIATGYGANLGAGLGGGGPLVPQVPQQQFPATPQPWMQQQEQQQIQQQRQLQYQQQYQYQQQLSQQAPALPQPQLQQQQYQQQGPPPAPYYYSLRGGAPSAAAYYQQQQQQQAQYQQQAAAQYLYQRAPQQPQQQPAYFVPFQPAASSGGSRNVGGMVPAPYPNPLGGGGAPMAAPPGLPAPYYGINNSPFGSAAPASAILLETESSETTARAARRGTSRFKSMRRGGRRGAHRRHQQRQQQEEEEERDEVMAEGDHPDAHAGSTGAPTSPVVTFSPATGFSSLHGDQGPSAIWLKPSYVDLTANPQLEGVLGGSDRDWPLAWDGRRYLSIWGGNRGGCCHAKHNHEHDATTAAGATVGKDNKGKKKKEEVGSGSWGQEFTLSLIEVDPKLFKLVKKRAAEAKLLLAPTTSAAINPTAAAASNVAALAPASSKALSNNIKDGHSFAEEGVQEQGEMLEGGLSSEVQQEEEEEEARFAEVDEGEDQDLGGALEDQAGGEDQEVEEGKRKQYHSHRFASKQQHHHRRGRSLSGKRHPRRRMPSSSSSFAAASAATTATTRSTMIQKDETDPLEAV